MSVPAKRARGTPVPWLCVLLIVGCAAVNLYASISSREALARVDASLSNAEAYFRDHPYLYPGQVLEVRLTSGEIDASRDEWTRRRDRRGSAATPPRVRRRQQEELRALVAEATSQLEASASQQLAWNVWERDSLTLLSHIFLHAGQWHLIGNALLLLLIGAYLETRMGRALFAGSLGACAVGSAWAFAFANPAVDFALIGLSGALAGLLTIFALRHWRDRREGFYALGVVGGAVWLVLPAHFGFQWSIQGTIPGMGALAPASASYSALAGGSAMGLFAAALIGFYRLDERLRGGSDLHGRDAASPLYRRAMRARSNRDYDTAYVLLSELLTRDPESHDAALLLAQVAVDLGKRDDADNAMLRAIQIELKRGLTQAAMDNWISLAEGGIPRRADHSLCIRMAVLLQDASQPSAARAALRGALDRLQKGDDPLIASKIARAARDLDPQTAEEAAWRALGSIELAFEERQSLEVLLGEIIPLLGDGRLEVGAGSSTLDDAPEAGGADLGLARKPSPIDIDLEERALMALDAVPLECGADGVRVIVARSGAKKLVPYQSIDAVAVAAVQGIGRRPVIIVDLVLNWMTTANEKLRVVRLRGDKFDPRNVVSGIDSPSEALRRFLDLLIERAAATPLPDPAAAHGRPFASFSSLADYHRTVLRVEVPED
jgi:membrane associated rhomboid family serine protease